MTDRPARTAEHSTAADVARALEDAGLGKMNPPAGSEHTTVRTLRRLSEGRPLPASELRAFAAGADDTEEVAVAIERMSERDSNGDIVGYMGLSLADHPHSFEVGGRQLRTWCAWDALFLPAILGATAHVASQDPATGQAVRLTVTPHGVESTEPAGVVVSVVVPSMEDAGALGAQELQETFCDFVHFFTDLQEAARWFEERETDVRFISVEEAFELGRIRFADFIVEA